MCEGFYGWCLQLRTNFSTCCRKKRKWDQPAQSVVSAGVALPGAVPLGSLVGISVLGAASVSGAILTNPQATAIPPVFQVPLMPQSSAAVGPKSNQVRYLL